MLDPTVGPKLTINVGNQVAKKLKSENICATLVMPNLAYAVPNALKDGIAMIHMERRVG